ncbi:MAG TPA: hypothetical protein DCQ06_03070 [Myxococcales bacterium]|nr:hypothetical protein [Myxococcales bacterium]
MSSKIQYVVVAALVMAMSVTLSLPSAATAVTGRVAAKKKRSKRSGAKRAPRAAAKPKKKDRVVTTFMAGTPIFVVREAFRCAMEYDAARGFDCYIEYNVETNRNSIPAKTHLRKYQWRHFLRFAASYVAKGAQFGLTLTRQVPKRLTPKTSQVKFFFRSRHRDNPAPIVLRREGNKWRIYQNSL